MGWKTALVLFFTLFASLALPLTSQIAFIPILACCFGFRIIKMSLAPIAGLNSLVSVAGSWTLLRMHFAEFLKLLDIFALLNFSNFSSRGKFTNVLFNFCILQSAKKNYISMIYKKKTQMQDWCRGRQLSGFQFGKSDFKSNQFAQHFFRITPNQFYFWETL